MENTKQITVDIKGLMELCGIGKKSALKLADQAGAQLKVGRRTLYNVRKIEKFIDDNSGGVDYDT